ncbi:hypothetical protein ACF1G4_03430 [Streptomyces caelestis]
MSESIRTVLDRARDALNARMSQDALRLVLENTITYAAELERQRNAFRDQRNNVVATNEQLHAKVTEAFEARLRAENETRTVKREFADAAATVAELVQKRGERMKVENALRDQVAELEAQVAELEAEAAGQRRAGYQVAINVMRQEKLPMSVGLLEAQLELEAFDHPKPHERPAGAYPPALPWAALMDADDLEGFLADLVDAASGDDDLSTLTEVESTIARWRLIAEAQHAHNTAPGPNTEADE